MKYRRSISYIKDLWVFFFCFRKAEGAVILAIAKFFSINQISQSTQRIATFTHGKFVLTEKSFLIEDLGFCLKLTP